jgi:hypothetical protein
VGTRGPGAFGNDDALNLPGTLTGQDAVARRPSLQQIFRTIREQPEDLNWTPGPAEIVAAAAAVVAAGLPAGEAVVREITRHDYAVAALVIAGSDPELAGAALATLLTAPDAMAPGIKASPMPGRTSGPPDDRPARLGLLPLPAPARSGTALESLTACRHGPPLPGRPPQADTSMPAEDRHRSRTDTDHAA